VIHEIDENGIEPEFLNGKLENNALIIDQLNK
jgi:hypothetical protein